MGCTQFVQTPLASRRAASALEVIEVEALSAAWFLCCSSFRAVPAPAWVSTGHSPSGAHGPLSTSDGSPAALRSLLPSCKRPLEEHAPLLPVPAAVAPGRPLPVVALSWLEPAVTSSGRLLAGARRAGAGAAVLERGQGGTSVPQRLGRRGSGVRPTQGLPPAPRCVEGGRCHGCALPWSPQGPHGAEGGRRPAPRGGCSCAPSPLRVSPLAVPR